MSVGCGCIGDVRSWYFIVFMYIGDEFGWIRVEVVVDVGE